MARASTKKSSAPAPIRGVEERIAEIKKMSVKQLQALWQELYGAPSSTHNRPFLRKRLAFRVQELARGGGLSARGEEKAEALLTGAPGPRSKAARSEKVSTAEASSSKKDRDPRLPKAGTVIEREHKGKVYKVTVHDTDFEYQGKRFNSLSTIAREITGQVWNGYLFWGLIVRGAKKGAA